MNATLFDKLTTSLRQAKAIRSGTLQPSRVTRLAPDHPAAVRSRLGMSQPEFAELIGVPLGTLRNWEQGHRQPTGPAKSLLVVAAQFPREVAVALKRSNAAAHKFLKRESVSYSVKRGKNPAAARDRSRGITTKPSILVRA